MARARKAMRLKGRVVSRKKESLTTRTGGKRPGKEVRKRRKNGEAGKETADRTKNNDETRRNGKGIKKKKSREKKQRFEKEE